MPHANAMMLVPDTTIVVMIMKHCAWEVVLVDAKMVMTKLCLANVMTNVNNIIIVVQTRKRFVVMTGQ